MRVPRGAGGYAVSTVAGDGVNVVAAVTGAATQDPLASQVVQLLFMAVLVIFSVAVGQAVYQYASGIEKTVKKHIRDRKRPELKYVLYDMFWAPASLLTVFIILRVGVLLLPPGSVMYSLITVMNALLIGALLWLSLRIVKEVMTVAEQAEEP